MRKCRQYKAVFVMIASYKEAVHQKDVIRVVQRLQAIILKNTHAIPARKNHKRNHPAVKSFVVVLLLGICNTISARDPKVPSGLCITARRDFLTSFLALYI